MSEERLTLGQVQEMIDKKYSQAYIWISGVSDEEPTEGLEASEFRCLVPKDAGVTRAGFNSQQGLILYRGDQRIDGDIDAPVLLWESEILKDGEDDYINLEGALNGVLVINNEVVTWDDLALIGLHK